MTYSCARGHVVLHNALCMPCAPFLTARCCSSNWLHPAETCLCPAVNATTSEYCWNKTMLWLGSALTSGTCQELLGP